MDFAKVMSYADTTALQSRKPTERRRDRLQTSLLNLIHDGKRDVAEVGDVFDDLSLYQGPANMMKPNPVALGVVLNLPYCVAPQREQRLIFDVAAGES